MPVFAHAGHWIESVVFAVPVVILGGAMLVDRFRNRHRDRDDAS
jgi:hypothetical protein